MAQLLEGAGLTDAVKTQVAQATSLAELRAKLEALPEPTTASQEVAQRIARWNDDFRQSLVSTLDAWAPRFFYFDDYSVMPGRISVPRLKGRAASPDLTEGEKTFLAFLALGGAELSEFEDESNFERLTRTLEATANGISEEVFAYWTQNKQLGVNVQVSKANPADEPPLNDGTILNVRIRNDRHGVTVPFDERSRGFVWFLSFFAYFSELQAKPGRLVLLLTSPA